MDTTMHNSLTENSIWKSAVAQFNDKFFAVEKEVAYSLGVKLDSVATESILVKFTRFKRTIHIIKLS